MPKSYNYEVTLYPAKLEGAFVSTTIDFFGGVYPKKNISVAGMDNLINEITNFANNHGEGCSASVKCLAPRKPPGFKDATANLYFNLEPKDNAEVNSSQTSQFA